MVGAGVEFMVLQLLHGVICVVCDVSAVSGAGSVPDLSRPGSTSPAYLPPPPGQVTWHHRRPGSRMASARSLWNRNR